MNASPSAALVAPSFEGDYAPGEPFSLEAGGVLESPILHYAIYGEPKADNVILVAHALSGSARVADWWPRLFSDGGLFHGGDHCIVGINIPFALFFATILLVIMGESANLLSVGAVVFGIIVDSAVILVENIFKNFQRTPEERQGLLQRLSEGFWGPDPTRMSDHLTEAQGWTDRLRMILISAVQVDKAVLFSAMITVAGFVPLFTMQGVEGQIFGPMARTYGYALAGALIATFTITPVIASFLMPAQVREIETIVVRSLHRLYNPALRFALTQKAVERTM